MQTQRSPRRPAGTGSLFVRSDQAGRQSWYAKYRVGGRQVKRGLGPRREPGTTRGLTRSQAEVELRRLLAEAATAPALRESLTLAEAAQRYLHHVEHVRERKPSTVQDYRIMVRRHLAPFFAGRRLDAIDADQVAAYVTAKRREGLSGATINHHLTLLHGVYAHAVRRRWTAANPVLAVDRPPQRGANPDIRFLEVEELEAVLRAVPDDALGPLELVLYVTAAMTGLRQGELLALRWRDIDWGAGVVRVRRSWSRGRLSTPKSRRSARAVPLADRVAAELERHSRRSAFAASDDLVFCHPATGNPYDPSKLRRRFDEAVGRAGVRRVTFHGLRHTFGTQMAAAGAPLRAIQEWMGHRDHTTTLIYADYAPDPSQGAAWAARAFGPSRNANATPEQTFVAPSAPDSTLPSR
jgi:integrase